MFFLIVEHEHLYTMAAMAMYVMPMSDFALTEFAVQFCGLVAILKKQPKVSSLLHMASGYDGFGQLFHRVLVADSNELRLHGIWRMNIYLYLLHVILYLLRALLALCQLFTTILRSAHFVKHLFSIKRECLIYKALLAICSQNWYSFLMKMEVTDMDERTKSFGSGLKTAREMRNLSLREIEQATGISNAYLSQLENGKIKKPSPHFLHKLASLYGIGYEQLMEAVGYVQSTKTGGPKTLAGAALFSQEKLTAEEEEELAKYLAFLRSKRK